MTKKTKHTLLKGEGIHQHTLYGDFQIGDEKEYTSVLVEKDCLLKHEKPNGRFSNEHRTLKVEKGSWVMGRQVEYNPFDNSTSSVWD